MEHLALEIFDLPTKEDPKPTGSKYAALEGNSSITITDTSEVFAKGDVWSHSFTLNIPANAHIFGTAGDMHGARLHEQINKRRARLWAMGLPLHLGYLTLGDEAEVDEEGNVDVGFESGQHTFDEMIDGAKANQVPMMGDVEIGMALWRKRWTRFKVKLQASLRFPDSDVVLSGPVKNGENDWFTFTYDGEDDGNSVQEYPRMVFPKGDFSNHDSSLPGWNGNRINTDSPYMEDSNGTPTNPYCNVALCYQKSGYERKDEDGNIKPDYSAEPEAQRGYEYMPADRVNSAPCFFVIYWIRALMKHLGIYVEENQMLGVEDLRRLFFVNTNCAYEEPKYLRSDRGKEYRGRYGAYKSETSPWLIPEYFNSEKNVSKEDSGFKGTDVKITGGISGNVSELVSVKISDIEKWGSKDIADYLYYNNWFHRAFATSECFPDVDISEVISALESGFGIRFLFSDNYKRVRIVLLRNIFRNDAVQDIRCDVVSHAKTENAIRGFRMTYGDSEDTHFYYKGFDDKLPKKNPYFADNSDKHDYSYWNLNAKYARIINKVSAFDKTCYVTPDTGNAYIIKIDKDAKRYDQLHPSLFEGAGFMNAEDGDCTGEDNTIDTVNVGFTPAIMNDLNMDAERGEGDKEPVAEQRFALFVDETMRPRRPDIGGMPQGNDGIIKTYDDPRAVYDVNGKLYEEKDDSYVYGNMMADGIVKPGEFAIKSDMYASSYGANAEISYNSWIVHWNAHIEFDIEGHINEGYRLYLQDNFEPGDDGVSPIEKHDWGLTLGIMRGSGSDAKVEYSADPDDHEGNDTWDLISGSSVTAHPDTCDNYGNEWDYNMTRKVSTRQDAVAALQDLFPNSNAPFYIEGWDKGYINHVGIEGIFDDNGKLRLILIAKNRSSGYSTYPYLESGYTQAWNGHSAAEIMDMDKAGYNIIIEIDSSAERGDTLLALCKKAYGYNDGNEMIIDENGVGSRYGRFSLKLRAEKPNPYYVEGSQDPYKENQYLEITDPNLRQRGLSDQFYKEYSYWVRNARIANMTVEMTLAQLLAIDKTKRVRVGDITGFIRKMQYTISNQTGLGMVTMEIMYI